MATRGRPPKSRKLRIVEGNRGHRPIPEAGPEVEGRPAKPQFLEGRASILWNQYQPIAHWLSATDTHAMAVWCALTAEVEEGVKGMNAARIAQWRALSSELGLNPTARARIGPQPRKPQKAGAASEFFD